MSDAIDRTELSRAEVAGQLRALGVVEGGVLLVHTSFRATRPVEGGPAGLIAALRDAVGPDGTIVMPSWTGDGDAPFDPRTTPASPDLGVVADTFWRLPGVVRSDHPSAFAAQGPRAALVTADPLPLPPHVPASPVGRVHELDGQVLLLGVNHSEDTTLHLAELLAGVPYGVPQHCTVLRDGRPVRLDYLENDHCCLRFALADGWLRERGLQREGRVGHAEARLVRSRDVVAVALEQLARDPLVFLHPADEGCAECDAARASVAEQREVRVRANGVELCVQTFGAPTDPAVLLLAGTGCSMDWWEEELCARLAAGSRFVIRYDQRDTGRSVSYEAGAPPYTLRDLAADAVGLLDALAVERAHLVGMSMGGWVAQLVALDHAPRVASLTLLSTRPTPHGPADADLPEVSEALQASFAEPAAEPDWSDREAAIDYLVESERPFVGSLPFDTARKRRVAARVFDRTANLAASMTNHYMVDGGARWRERLGAIVAPTLVLHGTEDPLFPPGNAVALAREIPGARLRLLDGVGHEMPPREAWDDVVTSILDHTAGTAARSAMPARGVSGR